MTTAHNTCPHCGLPLDGHNWTCTPADNDYRVIDHAAYRAESAA